MYEQAIHNGNGLRVNIISKADGWCTYFKQAKPKL